MKKIIALVVIIGLGVALGGVYKTLHVEKLVVEKVKTEYVDKEVIKSELETRIENAQNASSSAIEAEAQKAHDAKKEQMLKQIELDIRTQYENELKVERVKLEKEVGSY